jgi:hypothetical protein
MRSTLVLEHSLHLTGSEIGYVGYIDEEPGHLVCTAMSDNVWDQCKVMGKNAVQAVLRAMRIGTGDKKADLCKRSVA